MEGDRRVSAPLDTSGGGLVRTQLDIPASLSPVDLEGATHGSRRQGVAALRHRERVRSKSPSPRWNRGIQEKKKRVGQDVTASQGSHGRLLSVGESETSSLASWSGYEPLSPAKSEDVVLVAPALLVTAAVADAVSVHEAPQDGEASDHSTASSPQAPKPRNPPLDDSDANMQPARTRSPVSTMHTYNSMSSTLYTSGSERGNASLSSLPSLDNDAFEACSEAPSSAEMKDEDVGLPSPTLQGIHAAGEMSPVTRSLDRSSDQTQDIDEPAKLLELEEIDIVLEDGRTELEEQVENFLKLVSARGAPQDVEKFVEQVEEYEALLAAKM